MAITDDGITDEKLVDDLENMRIKDEPPASSKGGFPLGLGPPPEYQAVLDESYAEYPLQPGETEQEEPESPSSDSSWNTARQALLICRELVRTERRYLASLKTLIKNGTATPPPPSMLPYLPGLIAASDALLQLMEKNPSVQGVSEAFLGVQEHLNDAFVQWCGVVAEFFRPEAALKARDTTDETPEVSSSGKSQNRAPSTRTSTTDSLPVVMPEPNKIRRGSKSRPPVRDLAILPTQRITRYVLLFKGGFLSSVTKRRTH